MRGDQDRILVELWQGGPSARSDFRQLERKHFDWMASMPHTLMHREEVFLCHASPRDDITFWLDYVSTDGGVRASPIDIIEARAEGINADVILCGHTHIPRVVRLRDGRMVVNAGSVGLPGYDGQAPVSYVVEVGTPHACYAILEHAPEGWSASIRYVPYDNAAMAALARARECSLGRARLLLAGLNGISRSCSRSYSISARASAIDRSGQRTQLRDRYRRPIYAVDTALQPLDLMVTCLADRRDRGL